MDSLKVIGIRNNCKKYVTEMCDILLNALNSDFSAKLTCLVQKELSGDIPSYRVNYHGLNLLKDFLLADPYFYQPNPVIIGADIFRDILT